MRQIQINKGEDRYSINLTATIFEDSIAVILVGGEKPHIGAVVMSIPRHSLDGSGKNSTNTFVLPVVGHKDDEIAKPMADKICRETGMLTVVCAGIHIDTADEREIRILIKNTEETVNGLLLALGKHQE